MEVESALSYRIKQDDSSSSSDSDDSQKDFVWKRTTKKESNDAMENKFQKKSLPSSIDKQYASSQNAKALTLPVSRKRKANSIWCSVLEDQTMSETLKDCGLRAKPANASRNCESYDYTLKYSDPRNNLVREENMSSDEKLDDGTDCSQPKHAKRLKTNSTKYVKLDNSSLAAAKRIIKVLNEQKQYLIYRVVKVIGEENALKILKMTEDIEENGGMMIKNNSRRRTPGGVYFQLLKSDKSVTKEQVDEIFEGEYSSFELRRIYKEQKKKKKLESGNSQDTEKMDLRTTLSSKVAFEPIEYIKQPTASATADVELEEGEIDD